MKLKINLTIKQTIYLDDYTFLIGANDVGKSTVFSALHVFFSQYRDFKTRFKYSYREGFPHSDIKEPIINSCNL
jgi:putative ATP-dependent endonuclease of OLD family